MNSSASVALLPDVWWDKEKWRMATSSIHASSKPYGISSLLLVVLSRNWIHRPFCLKELRLFRERWSEEDDFTVGHRIVVVRLNEVPVEDCPELLTKQVGYKFYKFNGPAELGKERLFFDRGEICDELYSQRAGELGGHLWRRAWRIVQRFPIRSSRTPQPRRGPRQGELGRETAGRFTWRSPRSICCKPIASSPRNSLIKDLRLFPAMIRTSRLMLQLRGSSTNG